MQSNQSIAFSITHYFLDASAPWICAALRLIKRRSAEKYERPQDAVSFPSTSRFFYTPYVRPYWMNFR
jgi:hypothetical protein